MKKLLIILGGLVLVVVIIAVVFYQITQDGLNKLADITLNDLNLDQVADGSYNGSYSVFPVSVEVTVTVSDHVITEIDITKHDNGQGQAGEAIIEDVLEAQSLEVDVISGATYSSKVILLAIQDALAR